jgi:hypothetical protein
MKAQTRTVAVAFVVLLLAIGSVWLGATRTNRDSHPSLVRSTYHVKILVLDDETGTKISQVRAKCEAKDSTMSSMYVDWYAQVMECEGNGEPPLEVVVSAPGYIEKRFTLVEPFPSDILEVRLIRKKVGEPGATDNPGDAQ